MSGDFDPQDFDSSDFYTGDAVSQGGGGSGSGGGFPHVENYPELIRGLKKRIHALKRKRRRREILEEIARLEQEAIRLEEEWECYLRDEEDAIIFLLLMTH